MSTKKLKSVEQNMMIPEGLYILPTPVMLFQKNSGILWANPFFEKEFGNTDSTRFIKQQQIHVIREKPITLQVLSMVGRHEGFVIESINRKKIPVELKVTHYGDASNECYLIMVEDVSAKVELEKQLIENHLNLQSAFEKLKSTQDALVQAGKLASLGELTTGIAHELNQPLQAIMGFSQELQITEKLSVNGSEFLNDIVNASQKMAEIIKSLRSFAREAGDALGPTSVTHAVNEATKMMRHQLMQNGIEVEINSDEHVPLAHANSIQLEQVIINLLSNARDAIESAHREQGEIKINIYSDQESVKIKVSDNGCGMDEKTKTKIFDPFFTTKEVGKGTGLGMSISYGIIKKMNADIEVTSNLDTGTDFIVSLKKSHITKTTGEAA